jgi:hypothetical protein
MAHYLSPVTGRTKRHWRLHVGLSTGAKPFDGRARSIEGNLRRAKIQALFCGHSYIATLDRSYLRRAVSTIGCQV